jgi:hypothetical protein
MPRDGSVDRIDEKDGRLRPPVPEGRLHREVPVVFQECSKSVSDRGQRASTWSESRFPELM